MNECPVPPAMPAGELRYELRFAGLFNRGRGFGFPCDSQGHVHMDAMNARTLSSYLYARAMVGSELCNPVVLTIL